MEAAGVWDGDDDGVLCTGTGNNTVGEVPLAISVAARRWLGRVPSL